jgi:hypothetical protein
MGFWDWLFVQFNGPRPRKRKASRGRARGGTGASGSERRRVPRFAGLGARVIVDGVEYDVADWAENSYRVTGYSGDLIERQLVHFRFLLVYREETWEWPGIGRVVRHDPQSKELAVVYRPPEEPFRTRLRHVMEALREGRRLTELTKQLKDGRQRPDEKGKK